MSTLFALIFCYAMFGLLVCTVKWTRDEKVYKSTFFLWPLFTAALIFGEE